MGSLSVYCEFETEYLRFISEFKRQKKIAAQFFWLLRRAGRFQSDFKMFRWILTNEAWLSASSDAAVRPRGEC